ncbi:MAG: cysteine synthase A [Clostridia bacterium]|nr:cysteine synthase A [Clostridia bacterium]
MNIYTSIDELIAKTPLMDVSRYLDIENTTVLAKLEYFNPAGSVKDRAALQMLNDAESKGFLQKGTVIIEPTSGNTGIGLAAICAERGYKIILTMPETMSIERQKLLKAYGAQIVLTDGSKGMKGAIEKAEELAKSYESSFIPSQFTNHSNVQAHINTTGPEIYEDTDGKVDIFIAGVGTGGTLTGVGKYLKSKNPKIKIIAMEPYESPILSGGEPSAHGIQGIGANFIPEILDTDIFDEVVTVKSDDAMKFGREFAKKSGILVGISSGAALCAAVEIAKRTENIGKTIVTLLPDTGDRYLSTKMFE